MKLFLYGHGGSRNHGCEAIVRSTAGIFNGNDLLLYSYNPDEDRSYGIEKLYSFLEPTEIPCKKCSAEFLSAYLALKLKKDSFPLDRLRECNILSLSPKDSIAFSIGGDNYCYGHPERYYLDHARLKKEKRKTVLWGCSVEPSVIDRAMAKDLSHYDLITARESITYEALKPINSNTILAPDPAFTLAVEPGHFPKGLGSRPYIGINVSPLIQECERKEGITLENYRALIRHILAETDRDIALIPHVVWEHNDDRIPLKQLFDEFADSGRIYPVEDQNCMQLKDIISHSEFFVGARTHATIAAYSTCVPTLVVGYSVKARGIARDLFGTEEGYVLPVQSLAEPDDLTKAFAVLYEKRIGIKAHLDGMMTGYISEITKAKETVEAL